MSELEEKLSTILSNPQMMQQIASLAQAMGVSQPEPPKPQPPAPSLPNPELLQGIAGALQQGSINQEQQELLHALTPFLSQGRIGKLERAMRAARMASVASVFLKSGGLNLFGGR